MVRRMADDRDDFLAAALEYAARGWSVFPLRPGTKGSDSQGKSSHLLPRGHNDASSDLEDVRAWWTRWPTANIGLHLAASGLVALDADTYKAGCGWAQFVFDLELPDTLVQVSPRGGRHYIFRARPAAQYRGILCPGVEIKHRGYILLEPSTFEGRAYKFETNIDPAPVPDWVPVKEDGDTRAKSTSIPHCADAALIPSSVASSAEVNELLSWIDPDGGGYEAWLEVLLALHDHFRGSPEGLAMAEGWSARGAKFKPGEVASKWRGFRKGGGITVRTIAQRARQGGADLSDIARKYGVPTQSTCPEAHEQEESLDLSHDALALDLGLRGWDEDARYVALWGKWLFWTGQYWRRDETLEHLTRVRQHLRTRADDLISAAAERGSRYDNVSRAAGAKLVEQARAQARGIRSHSTVAAVANLARANPASSASHTAFDADRTLLGTPQGTVDLRTGTVSAARRDDMISRVTAYPPAPARTPPERWLRFLAEIFEGDDETISFLKRASGYALTGSTAEHKLLFFHGSGRNGKSVFLNTLLDIWGDYGRRVPAATFLNSQTERHPTDIAGLQGVRLAVASELPRGKTWDEAVIKDLTGGDRMTARFMRQDFFEFEPQLTLMIAGNTQPSFRGVDEAIRSRVVLVPFSVTVPAEQRDTTLPEQLRNEAPAILRWCIDGAVEWMERGLDVPATITAASKRYFDEEDTVGQFLADETTADPQSLVATDVLSYRFSNWSDRQGLGSWSKRTLVKEIRSRGFTDAKTNGRRALRGLRLR